MNNLASKSQSSESNLTYADFFAHARRKADLEYRKALGRQHRYGAMLLLICLISLFWGAGSDLTVLFFLAPLGIALLISRQIFLYEKKTDCTKVFFYRSHEPKRTSYVPNINRFKRAIPPVGFSSN